MMPNIPLKFSRKGMAALFVALIVFSVLLIAVILRQKSSVHSMQMELDSQLTQLNDAKALSSRFDEEKKRLTDMQLQLRQLEGNLSTKQYVPTLLEQLQKLAIDSNDTLLTFRPTFEASANQQKSDQAAKDAANAAQNPAPANQAPPPPPPPPPANPPANGQAASPGQEKNPADNYDKYKVDLELQGQYKDVMRFVFRLTGFPKIVSVENFQLHNSSSGVGDVPGRASATMNITAFVLKGGA